MTTKPQFPIVLPYTAGAIKLTDEQAAVLFSADEIAASRKHGSAKCVGPWHVCISYTALTTSQDFNTDKFPTERGPLTVYGVRTLTGVKQSGYELEGRISVDGKRVRGFTSSQLFELPDGKLIDCATIHACLNQPK